MKYFVIFLGLIAASFGLLDVNVWAQTDEQITACPNDIQKILDQDPVIAQFLEANPSSEIYTHETADESGNNITQSEYFRDGLSLVVRIQEKPNQKDCLFAQSYHVSYDIPSLGMGISLTRGQSFEVQDAKDAVQAVKDLTNPHKQMKKGIPLYEIKCKEGLNSIVKRDRIKPACVSEETESELLRRGWTPLRIGMPAETNILITYGAAMVYPSKVTKEFIDSPHNYIFWVNNDIVPHTIVAEDGSWSTGQIDSGTTGHMLFNQTGSYRYHVLENPDAGGRIYFEKAVPEVEPTQEPEKKDVGFDSELFHEVLGEGSPLVYKNSSKPVLDFDNCERYANWLTVHQKEKIDKYEDYSRYPPWGNQIFPLVEFCTSNGDFLKFEVEDKLQWSFYKIHS